MDRPAQIPTDAADPRLLLAVPNVSEGRLRPVVDAVGAAYASGGARVLDVHVDPDHHRSVHTLAGTPGTLADAVAAGAAEALARIDLATARGIHPHVGALDVAPIVFLDDARRGAAILEALVLGDRLGALGLPVFLYGLLGDGRTRAEVRRGGPGALARRLAAGELRPDFGPARLHPTAGAVLVGARPPLLAFNVELAAPATVDDARRIAAAVREGGADGLPGVRAIGLELRHPEGLAAGRGAAAEDPGPAAGADADSGARTASPSRTGNRDTPRATDEGTGSATDEPAIERAQLAETAARTPVPVDGPAPIAQVSCNVEDHRAVPLARLVAAVAAHAPVAACEVVGLPPRAAFAGFPDDLPVRGRRILEDVLAD
ncbi:hypothetical protein SK069_18935 [Patulibacter brassicae]|uniref:Formiminotransferase N-terminal subdomain domain-containing protein n=1 Tax=Patulibacter brassicae TaxID=1705717 RepID=A0ABU4VSB2_9ACTN|nr:hypothetical protein [Patulibacter brassicae]MDX8153680.1 hypothetical protein [Patulibacter brassicae]